MNNPVELAIPFRVGPDGAIATVSNPSQILRQHVVSVVGTQKGERVMLPDFGANVQRFLFTENDPSLNALMQTEISDALARWEPLAKFKGATMEVDPQSSTAQIDVKYQDSSSNDPTQSLTVNVNTGQ